MVAENYLSRVIQFSRIFNLDKVILFTTIFSESNFRH